MKRTIGDEIELTNVNPGQDGKYRSVKYTIVKITNKTGATADTYAIITKDAKFYSVRAHRVGKDHGYGWWEWDDISLCGPYDTENEAEKMI